MEVGLEAEFGHAKGTGIQAPQTERLSISCGLRTGYRIRSTVLKCWKVQTLYSVLVLKIVLGELEITWPSGHDTIY